MTSTSISSYASSLFSRVASAEKAAELAKKSPPKIILLSDEAKTLAPHIRTVTDPNKLNAQTPFFKCPSWAALPAQAYHLRCTRDGIPLASLGLERFPFYIFGKSSVCDYILEHPSVSGIHAVIVFHGRQECFVLMDLASTNGVRLNGTRIKKNAPIPISVDSTIQFGFSSRIYKLQRGPAPSSKRLREDQEEMRERQKMKITNSTNDIPTTTSSSSSGVALNNENGNSNDNEELDIEKVLEEVQNENVIEVNNNNNNNNNNVHNNILDALNTITKPTILPALPETRHLYHVLIKHKDVRRPVSLAPRNKGDKITRSKTDALELAQAIRINHGKENIWSLEDFISIVRDYSECGSAKKDGDLGVVENGSYTESFDAAAFALNIGAVSEPVETELGIHLIYRAE